MAEATSATTPLDGPSSGEVIESSLQELLANYQYVNDCINYCSKGPFTTALPRSNLLSFFPCVTYPKKLGHS